MGVWQQTMLKGGDFSGMHPLFLPFSACYIESQNGLGWKGPLRSCSCNLLLYAGSSLTPGCSQPHPAWPAVLPGRGTHSLSGQPVPAPHHPHSEEFLPNIWYKSPLFRFKAISPLPVTTCPYKKSSPAFL